MCFLTHCNVVCDIVYIGPCDTSIQLAYVIYIYFNLILPFCCWNQNIWDDKVNTVSISAMAPCIASVSTAIVLNVKNDSILVYQEEGFQMPVLF